MGIPWWGWLIAALVGVFVLYRIALKAMSRMFRSISRRYLTNILQVLDADVTLGDGPLNRLRGTLQGRAIDLDLEPYFAAMTEALSTHPFREQMAVFGFLESSLPDHGPLVSVERHRPWIRPKLITGDDLLTRQQVAPLPSTPLGDTGLQVIYMVAGENAPLSFAVTAEQMSQLGFADAAELHQHAADQLIPHTPREAIDNVLQRGEASALGMHDGFVAARVLAVQNMLGPDDSLVALIPDPDSCVLLPVPEDNDWSAIHESARIPLHDGKMLINQPVLVRHDAIQLVAR
jgi:hypothetical protein